MTPERKKAIISIAATLVVGILIGILATGMFARQHYRGNKNYSGKEYRGNPGGFVKKIYKITEADSPQRKQMQPIVEQTKESIDALQQKTDEEVKALLDSMIVNLKPILKEEQLSKLQAFSKNKRGYEGHRRNHK